MDEATAAAAAPSAEQSVCVICMESFAEGDVLRTLPCFHNFHCGCVDQWLEHKRSCPVCKTGLDGAIEELASQQQCSAEESSTAEQAPVSEHNEHRGRVQRHSVRACITSWVGRGPGSLR